MAGGRSSGIAKLMKGKKFDDVRKGMTPKPPKGFDISLGDFMAKYKLSNEQVQRVGKLTATRGGIAHATIGHNVWYRERQLVEILELDIAPNVYTPLGGNTFTVVGIDEMTESPAKAVGD